MSWLKRFVVLASRPYPEIGKRDPRVRGAHEVRFFADASPRHYSGDSERTAISAVHQAKSPLTQRKRWKPRGSTPDNPWVRWAAKA